MRELKRKDTSILTGYQIYHNYVRELQALEIKHQLRFKGIKIEAENKWLTLIDNSKKIPYSMP
jgi:hypothetical protein